MNPLAWKQCVQRLVTTVAAMASLLIVAGCGSGNDGIIRPLPGGYTNASLKGQYVMTQTGIGINQAGGCCDPFSEVVVFSADGSGNLTVTVDDFDQSGGPYGGKESLSGTYHVNTDGTGYLIFNYVPTTTYRITMIDDSHFYLIEQDFFATSYGYGEKQDTTAVTATPAGNFVFKAHNVETSARVGGITITGGAISGNEDLLTLGLTATPHAIASSTSMNAPDVNGRGTFALDDGSSFNYYVVNSSKFYFLSNSASGSLEIGQAEAQTGSFSLATLAAGSSYVFGGAGDTSNSGLAGIHSAGVFTSDGAGNLTGGAVDYVQDTTLHQNAPVSGGTYTLAPSGRGQINLALTGDTISPQIFWMVNGTRAYFLADNTAAVEDGTFQLQQTPVPSALANQAAFVMDGFDLTYKDRVGAFAPSSSGFKWSQQANAFDPTIPIGTATALGTSGTISVDSKGRAAVTVNGVTNSLVFYMISGGSGFMVQEDADIGGAFAQQASQ